MAQCDDPNLNKSVYGNPVTELLNGTKIKLNEIVLKRYNYFKSIKISDLCE